MNKWKSSIVSLVLAFFMLISVLPASAAAQETQIQVNGNEIDFASQAPVVVEGTAYAPMEDLFKALDATLVDSDDQSPLTVLVNEQQMTLNANPRTIQGTAYVPVRSVSEKIGYKVDWGADSRTIFLTGNAAQEGGRGFLWEVKNGGNTVYLVGSIHVADSSFYPLHPSFEEAFSQADYLGVEIDLSKAQDASMQDMMMSLGMYQDGTTLKDHISPETYKQVGDILSRNGIKTDALDAFKPWVVETVLTSLKAAKSGYEGDVGIDLHFIQKAMQQNIPVIELESYESQLNMLSGFSAELQEANLQAAIENFDLEDDSVEQMADMWKKGDEAGLLALTNSMMQNEEYYKAMLVDRNVAMADKIEGYLTGEQNAEYFIVVGAAHYLGDDGIVKLLEDKGFTVTRK